MNKSVFVNCRFSQKGFDGMTSSVVVHPSIKGLKLVKLVFKTVICVGWVDIHLSTQQFFHQISSNRRFFYTKMSRQSDSVKDWQICFFKYKYSFCLRCELIQPYVAAIFKALNEKLSKRLHDMGATTFICDGTFKIAPSG